MSSPPSQANLPRRQRAETLSALPTNNSFDFSALDSGQSQSNNFVNQSANIPPSNTTNNTTSNAVGRQRAGSLTLPKPNNLQIDLGIDFNTSWKPSTNPTSNSKLKNSFDAETENISRTFEYLGLDEITPRSAEAFGSSAVSPLPLSRRNAPGVYQDAHVGSGRVRAHSSAAGLAPGLLNPEFSHLGISNSSTMNPLLSNLGGPSAGGRPRATTVGIVDRYVVDGVDLYGGNSSAYKEKSRYESKTLIPDPTPTVGVLLQSSVHVGYGNGDDGNEHDQDFQTPTRSLWVGNLDATITAADILNLFGRFGNIESLRMLPDKECVFVNFARIEDALEAKEAMTGRKLGSGVVKLGFGKNEAVGDTQGMQPTKSVWIGGLPPGMSGVELERMFGEFGRVESCRILTHKNCGFVNFENLSDAMRAQQAMNGRDVHGMSIRVGFAKVPSKSESQGLNVSTFAHNGGSGAVLSPQKSGRIGLNVDTFLGEDVDLANASVGGREYAASLLALPEPDGNRRIDQGMLREMRKRLESPLCDMEDVEEIFGDCYEEAVELCTDYIGNVVLQKLVDKSSDEYRAALIERLSPYLASLGVHKNGTWVVQKVIDSAQTSQEASLIVQSLQPYAPCLLLDQFGNYVIQCCLRLGVQGNQFIFDAIHDRCFEIGTGRFGARAMRSCLESQYTTKRQQKHVAVAIAQTAMQLITNINGNLVLSWLLDSSGLPGRYRILAPRLLGNLPALCRHKLANSIVLKIVGQRVEMDAREMIMNEIFFQDLDNGSPASVPTSHLREIISDHAQGVALVQKIFSTMCVTAEERSRLADRIRSCLTSMAEVKTNPMAYKRLFDEVNAVSSGETEGADVTPVTPLTPGVPFLGNPYEMERLQMEQLQQGYYPGQATAYQGAGYGLSQPGVGMYPQQQQQMYYGGYVDQQTAYLQQQQYGQQPYQAYRGTYRQ